jgi:hypothetical protein
MSFFPISSYLDKGIAVEEIAKWLGSGSLCLFLGAGISMSSSEFPSWVGLVRACAEQKGFDISGIGVSTPIDKLLKLMEAVRRKCTDFEEYKELVRWRLNESFDLGHQHLQNALLISIGALLMPSTRGSISDVVTYNFDDLLEWYLNLHGFRVQVVTELPFLCEDVDVRIFHPHGFLPKSARYISSSHFVFDSFEYDLLVGNEKSPWFAECKHILRQKIALMIGISCDDPVLISLVRHTSDELIKSGVPRPVTFLLNRSEAIVNEIEWYLDRSIVPIGFDNFEEIWQFILAICQNAAGKL